jgi:adenine-specific DNA-methyltransferase
MSTQQHIVSALCESALLKQIDGFRHSATKELDPSLRGRLGQFLTPLPIAAFMASLFGKVHKELHLFDAGAGTGMLSAATVCDQLLRRRPPRSVSITAFEIDPVLAKYLQKTYDLCAEETKQHGVAFSYRIIAEDFISYAVRVLQANMFSPPLPTLNAAIVNPPYSKINSDSVTRRVLRSVGVETSNLYTAFLALLAQLLQGGGELIAITPRSFCNGPYFRPFRVQFLDLMSLRRIHLFDSRSIAFRDDDVLQENIITRSAKTPIHPNRITVSASDGTPGGRGKKRSCLYGDVVSPEDKDKVIHLTIDSAQEKYRKQIGQFNFYLQDLGIKVSTGRVVDFRAREFLRHHHGPDTVPLIHPCHFNSGFISWPKEHRRKPNAIVSSEQTRDLLVPSGVYVLVKRFTSKEEKRRVVACIYDPSRVPANLVGFENHLDYFHADGNGLPMDLAKGLAAFLNSTIVDAFFRQFNGHTQVNASDLKRLRFPSRSELERLGRKIADKFPDQEGVDDLLAKEFF